MIDSPTHFPNPVMKLDAVVEVQVFKPLGLAAKMLVQEKARKIPLYNAPIQCDAVGRDNAGREIAINTAGRWLFGVPGYDGHIRVVSTENKVSLYYPKESSGIIHDLVGLLKHTIEEENKLTQL